MSEVTSCKGKGGLRELRERGFIYWKLFCVECQLVVLR